MLELWGRLPSALGQISDVDIRLSVYGATVLVGLVSLAKRRKVVLHDEDAMFEIAHHAALGGLMALCALLAISWLSPELGKTIVSKEPGLIAATGAMGFFAAGRHILRRV